MCIKFYQQPISNRAFKLFFPVFCYRLYALNNVGNENFIGFLQFKRRNRTFFPLQIIVFLNQSDDFLSHYSVDTAITYGRRNNDIIFYNKDVPLMASTIFLSSLIKKQLS